MNFDRVLQLHPLKSALGIDAYNERHLGPGDGIVTITKAALGGAVPHQFQSIAKLSRLATSSLLDLGPPAIASPEESRAEVQTDPAEINHCIADSRDKLFFVSYPPLGTLRKQWYLVRPDLDACAEVAQAKGFAATGWYVVDFFAKVSRDKDLSDPGSHWWSEWREFSYSGDGHMELGSRIKFAPNRKPDLERFTTYSNVLNLVDAEVTLLGPFDFEDALQKNPQD